MLGKDLGNGTPSNVNIGYVVDGDALTNPAWENRLVINVALDPSHQVLDVCRGRHLRRTLVVL
jgi:hypothetical protein